MRYSIIIPAYNEQDYILNAINSVKDTFKKTNEKYEIIVSNNNSIDNTVTIAKKNNCKIVNQKIQSISKTRNAGAKIASGDILIFTDADSRINIKLVNAMKQALNNNTAASTITNFEHYPTWQSYGVWIYNFFSLIFGLGVGQFIAIRKSDFIKINGFDEDYYAFEEIVFFRKVRKNFGKNSVKILTQPVISSSRKFEKGKSNIPKFLFQLLLACLGFNIGKRKEKLDFWYKKV